jgi:hypothetical protein
MGIRARTGELVQTRDLDRNAPKSLDDDGREFEISHDGPCIGK